MIPLFYKKYYRIFILYKLTLPLLKLIINMRGVSMNFQEFNNHIIIAKDATKPRLIKKINNENKLLNIKVIALSELKKKYFFDYDKETIFYVSKKYNVISEIAKIYIENLYFIKNVSVEKVEFLNNLKNDLIEHKLLKVDLFFKEYLKNKKIVLYELENVDKFYKNIFEEIKKFNQVIEYKNESDSSIKPLYKALNKDEEIAFVASSIAHLIKEGIDINKIKLANVQSNYIYTIKTIFKAFNIPVELPSERPANGTILVEKFKELYKEDMKSVFTELKSFVKDAKTEELYSNIASIVNEYTWCNSYLDVKDMLIKDVESIILPSITYKNAVRIIDFCDEIIEPVEYVFLINFNQGVLPANKKDEDFLNDEIKTLLGISTSIDTNIYRTKEVQNKIKYTKNLTVSYSTHDLSGELYISNAYDSELFINKDITEDYTSSNLFNKLKLVSAKDDFKKFGTITDELITLSTLYEDEPYCSYDNTFKQINSERLNNYLDNKLSLSYTSMNTYYKCAFRYYLEYILKVDKFEDNFDALIGNIFHKILSECFADNYDVESNYNALIEDSGYEFNNMEKFFLESLKDELKLIIDTIKEQMEETSLKKSLYEKEININLSDNVTFKGFVDKIIYDEFSDGRIAAIIDYKTGNPTLSLEKNFYGLDMQLPIYMYLIKKSEEFKDTKVGGFYLQKILSNTSNKDKRVDSLKLQGYSNSDINILEKVDNSYENSKIIKSMKVTSNGFSSYTKVLSNEEMDILLDFVDDKIRNAAKNIMDAKFDINPKEIGGKMEGCKYCKFTSICHRTNKDIVKLKSAKKEDILGGEIHA